MTFAYPAAWFLALAAPVLIALYLRRVRPRERTISSLLLWEQTLRLKSRARWWGRVRAWVSLLLQLLILLLLILALAKPEWNGTAPTPQVLVIDTRGRMQAVDNLGQSAFAKAQRYARDAANGARESAPVALVDAGETPRIVSGFSEDPAALQSTLEQLRPTTGGGDLAGAIQLARDLLTARGGQGSIEVLTDRAEAVEGVTIRTFGQAGENWGFTHAGARSRAGSDALQFEVTSRAAEPREVHFELEQAGRLIESRRLVLDPDQSTRLHFDLPPAGTAISASLRENDRLSADQKVTFDLPKPPIRRVLLISPGNYFLEKALRADETIQFEMLKPAEWKPELSAAFDLTIFDGWAPAELPPRGHFLFAGTAPNLSATPPVNPAVVHFDSTHPLMRNVQPDRWLIGKQAGTPSGKDFTEVVTGTAGPLVIAHADADRRWAALLFSLDQSDLPLRAGFPVFLQNLVDWTTQTPGESPPVTSPLDAEGGDLRLAQTSPLPTLQRWSTTTFWQWLALAAFALLLFEWAAYHRRWTE